MEIIMYALIGVMFMFIGAFLLGLSQRAEFKEKFGTLVEERDIKGYLTALVVASFFWPISMILVIIVLLVLGLTFLGGLAFDAGKK